MLLISVFLLLLISTITYSYYLAENERLQALQVQTSASVNNEKELATEINQKEVVLTGLGWNGGISKAWLIDQLGISLNEYPSISITDFSINPSVDKKRYAKEKETDNRNRIVIKGRCLTLDELNSWTRKLSYINWVDRVFVSQFTKSQDYNDDQQIFAVEILFSYEF